MDTFSFDPSPTYMPAPPPPSGMPAPLPQSDIATKRSRDEDGEGEDTTKTKVRKSFPAVSYVFSNTPAQVFLQSVCTGQARQDVELLDEENYALKAKNHELEDALRRAASDVKILEAKLDNAAECSIQWEQRSEELQAQLQPYLVKDHDLEDALRRAASDVKILEAKLNTAAECSIQWEQRSKELQAQLQPYLDRSYESPEEGEASQLRAELAQTSENLETVEAELEGFSTRYEGLQQETISMQKENDELRQRSSEVTSSLIEQKAFLQQARDSLSEKSAKITSLMKDMTTLQEVFTPAGFWKVIKHFQVSDELRRDAAAQNEYKAALQQTRVELSQKSMEIAALREHETALQQAREELSQKSTKIAALQEHQTALQQEHETALQQVCNYEHQTALQQAREELSQKSTKIAALQEYQTTLQKVLTLAESRKVIKQFQASEELRQDAAALKEYETALQQTRVELSQKSMEIDALREHETALRQEHQTALQQEYQTTLQKVLTSAESREVIKQFQASEELRQDAAALKEYETALQQTWVELSQKSTEIAALRHHAKTALQHENALQLAREELTRQSDNTLQTEKARLASEMEARIKKEVDAGLAKTKIAYLESELAQALIRNDKKEAAKQKQFENATAALDERRKQYDTETNELKCKNSWAESFIRARNKEHRNLENTIAILRTENTRLHHSISQLQSQIDAQAASEDVPMPPVNAPLQTPQQLAPRLDPSPPKNHPSPASSHAPFSTSGAAPNSGVSGDGSFAPSGGSRSGGGSGTGSAGGSSSASGGASGSGASGGVSGSGSGTGTAGGGSSSASGGASGSGNGTGSGSGTGTAGDGSSSASGGASGSGNGTGSGSGTGTAGDGSSSASGGASVSGNGTGSGTGATASGGAAASRSPNQPQKRSQPGTTQQGIARGRTPKPKRPQHELDAMHEFRKLIKNRLNITTDSDVAKVKRVTAEEAAAFEVDPENGPKKDDQPLSLLMGEAKIINDWNWAVGQILIEAFMADNPDTTVDSEFLKAQWLSRLDSLRRSKTALSKVEDAEAYHRDKLKLFVRRKNTSQNSQLAESIKMAFARLFELLTGQCMSSDDEDAGSSKPKSVAVLRKDWRSYDLISLFKWLDYYADHCGLSASGVKAGNTGYLRLRSKDRERSSRPVISGLLVNFYNAAYLASCSRPQLEALDLQKIADLPTYVLTWPSNPDFKTDPNDQDEYWRPGQAYPPT
ncbi:hypothetical protein B0H19DRAFT_1084409 [Mycena capillaripes]|nr:hypothetical protein B0H19DRAFT_1084409 [Mycena capillaripes]